MCYNDFTIKYKVVHYMKIFDKRVIAVLIMATVLTGCGDSTPQEIPVSTKEPATKAEPVTETTTEVTTEEATETETTTLAEEQEAKTSGDDTTEAGDTNNNSSSSNGGNNSNNTSSGSNNTSSSNNSGVQKPKVNQFTKRVIDSEYRDEYKDFDYRFVPEEATQISDDINLGLITVDGKEFDITELTDVYGEDEIRSTYNEKAGLFTTDQLIQNGKFEDVHITPKKSPDKPEDSFLFGENKGKEDIDVLTEVYSLDKSGEYEASDFVTVEYVNDWFVGLHSKCLAMNDASVIEQVTINGEMKPFIDNSTPIIQATENTDKLITFTDKNIAVGAGTTYGDIVDMFGAEPVYCDTDWGSGKIWTYRNSTVTVGFVQGTFDSVPAVREKKFQYMSEEERRNLPVVAVYMWLNE